MRWVILAALCVALVGCGGPKRTTRAGVQPVRIASGPISKACMASGRDAANRTLCGCVQFVADLQLSASDQRMAAEFFAEPHQAQEIRQSDSGRHEAFWTRYKAFAGQAEELCAGY